MNDDIDLDYYKKRLEQHLAVLMENQSKKDDSPVELDQTRMGRLSRMDAMQQQAMSQAGARLTALERQRTALKRMETGEYGYCIACEEEISEGRLHFDPSILTCISCAQKAEIK